MAKDKYKFGSIEIGQSMQYEEERGRLSAALSFFGKRHNKKFSTKVSENKVVVTRVS